jgi:hypothetical protein
MTLDNVVEFYLAEYHNGDILADAHVKLFNAIKAGDSLLLHQLIHKEVCEQEGADYQVFDPEDWPEE